MSTFWLVFKIVNGVAIAVLIGTFIWAEFDIHQRIAYVLLAQIPPIVMMGIRRAFRAEIRSKP